MIDIKRKDGENEEQFIWRICQAKESGELDMDWNEIADIINKEFREDESRYYSEASYRKPYQQAVRFYNAGVFGTPDDYLSNIHAQQRELKKLKQQVADERTDYQRTIREEARKESFVSVIERVLRREVEPFNFIPTDKQADLNNDDDMVICLSDLHAGIKCDNHWNNYNTDILRDRLHHYLNQIKDIQQTHHCRECHVVLGGDLISGLIHANLRLENNENVIEQVKISATYIGEFIKVLTEESFSKVIVHSVSGNHSRVTPNKDEHVTGEELDELVPFILKIMFQNADNVIIDDETDRIDSTIKSFRTRGNKLFYVVHGDKDKPSTVVSRLTLMLGVKPDAVIMSHRHHNAYDSQYGAKVIQTGSVVGTDSHCVDLRISGSPEQTVVITNPQQAVKCLYDVKLDD